MDLTLLGTGHPTPQIERGGISMVVSVGNEQLLIDCGPLAAHRLVEHEIAIDQIEQVFFTHHHLDHNGGFYYLAIMGWFYHRDQLTVYGPDGTEALLKGLDTAYHLPIESWREGETGIAPNTGAGLTDATHVPLTPDFEARGDGWVATAMPVDHYASMETYAYRFEEQASGASIVYSGDTSHYEPLSEFARDASVLVHDCNAHRDEFILDEPDVPEPYLHPPLDVYYRARFDADIQAGMSEIHSNPDEAALIATDAGVDTLVLTHYTPYHDLNAIREAAEDHFDGEVVIAEDGMTFSLH